MRSRYAIAKTMSSDAIITNLGYGIYQFRPISFHDNVISPFGKSGSVGRQPVVCLRYNSVCGKDFYGFPGMIRALDRNTPFRSVDHIRKSKQFPIVSGRDVAAEFLS